MQIVDFAQNLGIIKNCNLVPIFVNALAIPWSFEKEL